MIRLLHHGTGFGEIALRADVVRRARKIAKDGASSHASPALTSMRMFAGEAAILWHRPTEWPIQLDGANLSYNIYCSRISSSVFRANTKDFSQTREQS